MSRSTVRILWAVLAFILILPWLQSIILHEGWRTACLTLGIVTVIVLLPINLLVTKRPEDLGLLPDGEQAGAGGATQKKSNVVDAEWAAVNWTLGRAARTARFWWLAVSYFCGGYIWYAVQVHQTKYLVEIGFPPMEAAYSLGFVAMVGIPGQILLGWLSDRYGREPVWALSAAGFALTYLLLLLLRAARSFFPRVVLFVVKDERLRGLLPAGTGLTQFALAWILSFDAVTTVIPGGRRPADRRNPVRAGHAAPVA